MPDDEVAAVMEKVREYGAAIVRSPMPEVVKRRHAIKADIRRLVEERDEALADLQIARSVAEHDARWGVYERERAEAAEADAARLAGALQQLKPIAWFGKSDAEADGFKNLDERFVEATAALAAHDARVAAGKAGT